MSENPDVDVDGSTRVAQELQLVVSNMQNVHPGEWDIDQLTDACRWVGQISEELSAAAVAVAERERRLRACKTEAAVEGVRSTRRGNGAARPLRGRCSR